MGKNKTNKQQKNNSTTKYQTSLKFAVLLVWVWFGQKNSFCCWELSLHAPENKLCWSGKESGKGGLGRGGGEEEEGNGGKKVYRNQKRKRKLKTNLMDITEPEFPAEVQNMRALEWVYVELEPKLN